MAPPSSYQSMLVSTLLLVSFCQLISSAAVRSSHPVADVLYPLSSQQQQPQRTRVPSSVTNYLSKFGYLGPTKPGTENLRTETALVDAVKRLQRFAKLPTTGIVDDATRELLSRKRCGMPDYQYETDGEDFEVATPDTKKRHRLRHRGRRQLLGHRSRRVRRYALQGAKWGHKNLTYRIVNYSSRIGPQGVRRVVYDALREWQRVSGLSFTETESDSADIQILFAKRAHGDGYDFDGQDIVLAHAFFPGRLRGGDAHFDDDELWTDKPLISVYTREVSLFSVAVHEFGHSLGLSHSDVEDSLMYPYYRYQLGTSPLHYDDVIAIQKLYGDGGYRAVRPPPTTSTTTDPPPVWPTEVALRSTTTEKGPPDPCQAPIDAISRIRNEIFAFQGGYFWRMDNAGYLIERPVKVNRFWYGLPDDAVIDAVYEKLSRTRIMFFIGAQYWEFQGNAILPGYPKNLTVLGLPSSITKVNTVFRWAYNGRAYLFANGQYWRFNQNVTVVEPGYPKSMETWKGVPAHVGAAFSDANDDTWFFKHDNIYKFRGWQSSVARGYPLAVNRHWTHCRKANSERQRALGLTGSAPSTGQYSFAMIAFVLFVTLSFSLLLDK